MGKPIFYLEEILMMAEVTEHVPPFFYLNIC